MNMHYNHAIEEDDTTAVLNYIESWFQINVPDKEGCTPLMYAISINNESYVDALIAAGADMNARDKSDLTVLMLATIFWKKLNFEQITHW